MKNKKRLIDANALLEKVQFRMEIDNKNAEVIAGCVNITRRLIENAPTVDAVEVVHGRWVKLGKHDWACSVCKRGVPYSYTGHHYCPKCGAKMDLPKITDQTQAALDAIGRKAHGEE